MLSTVLTHWGDRVQSAADMLGIFCVLRWVPWILHLDVDRNKNQRVQNADDGSSDQLGRLHVSTAIRMAPKLGRPAQPSG
ncbi:hypothetical protein CGRA01v4_01562 [Colletotrichum graminicola]|nr:hypothetical protein CGRA01v4_01562 [Colletotrichum graminicola]